MAAADRDLLFGLLALKTGLIDQNQLADGVRAWSADKARTLADHLVSLGHLTDRQRPAVEAIATIHVEAHDGSSERSLAAIAAGSSTRAMLATVVDPEIERTLDHIGSGSEGDCDGTASFVVGTPTSSGQRFRVLRPHARGGLGAVHVALDQELHREVALKQLLDKHADDPISRARFLLEAEVTGGLEHPGIVPVYGLGTYSDGRPYYAMRFIKGDSLKDAIEHFHGEPGRKSAGSQSPGEPGRASAGSHSTGEPGRKSAGSHSPGEPGRVSAGSRSPKTRGADATPLAFRKLLRRFLDVCNAIEYAHSRGVLHRDIKPANIIVGKHGETLVVDWGLAKATGRADPGADAGEQSLVPSSASGSAETLPGRALGTPSFMSPEQAEGDLENLGPRSDVYSLGATLYFLLTGRPPVEGGTLGEVLGAVKQGQFPPPRRHDSTIDPALEAVCLKAMALIPDARYASPKALAEDIERWMADEPVSAWREPLSRRARRWAKRNRTAVTAAAVALLAGVVGLSAVLVVQTQAKTEIAQALGRETSSNKALAAANFELSRSRAAVQAQYELAALAIKTFHTGVSEDFLLKEEKFKELRDRLLKSASDFYGKLSALLGKETDMASRRALAAANFELAGLTAKVGRNADALAAHLSVLAARRELAALPGAGAADEADVGRSLTEVAGLLESAGKTDLALDAYREAEGLLSREASSSPEARAALAACRSRMGGFLTSIGKNDEALAAYRLARSDQEELAAAPDASPQARRELADTVNRIGRLLANTGRPREATDEYRTALRIRKKLADDDPADSEFRNALAASHNNLGILLFKSGRPKEAESEYRTALAIREQLAHDNPAVSEFRMQLQASHFNLGNLLRQTGRLKEAEGDFRSALAIERELADDNPTVPEFRRLLAINHHHLGTVLREMGQPRQAELEYRAAQSILRDLVATNPAVTTYRSELASTCTDFGVLLAESGRTREAEAQFRAGIANERELAEANSTVTEFRERLATGHVNLGELLSETGRTSESEPEYGAAQAIFRGLAEANPAVTYYRFGLAYTHIRRGLLLSQAGRSSEAESEDRSAAAIYRELAGRSPKVPSYSDGLASALTNLGDVLRLRGRMAEARDAYDQAIALRERLVAEHPKTPSYRSKLAGSLRRRGLARRDLGHPAGAAADVRRVLEIFDGLPTRSREEWYETACCHAAMAGLAATAGSGVSASQAASESDAAIALLKKAVGLGYRHADAVRTEPALDPLRKRADFRLLMMDLAIPAEPFASPTPAP
ncbi:MAG: tetratricopeptide repeat protein [Isosphaeraceae bacterium]